MAEGRTRGSCLPGLMDESTGRPLGTMLAARPSSASGFSSAGHVLGAGRLPALERPSTLDGGIDHPALLNALRIQGRPKSMSVATSPVLGRPITSHLSYLRPQREGWRPPPAAPSSSTPAAQHASAAAAAASTPAIWSLLQPLLQPLGPRASKQLPQSYTFDPLPTQQELPPLRGVRAADWRPPLQASGRSRGHLRRESWKSSKGDGGGEGGGGGEGMRRGQW